MKWEYIIKEIHNDEDEIDKLNEWGEERWELCSFSIKHREKYYYGVGGISTLEKRPYMECILKRGKLT